MSALTNADICTLACDIAKCPGMLVQAGQFLNVTLEKLAIKQNLDSIRRTTTISMVGGTPDYSLPLNYLRARQLTYSVNGIAFNPTEITYEEYQRLPQVPVSDDYPYSFAVDMGPTAPTPPASPSNPVCYFYPTPLINLTATLLYMDNTVTYTSPETSAVSPWFPDSAFLIADVAAQLMGITDDVRRETYVMSAENELRGYLQLNNGTPVKTIGLDPRSFRSYRNLPPTKVIPT